jgi:hypothetical protein
MVLSLSMLLAAVPSAVLAHGNIMEPAAAWQKGYPDTGFSSTVSSTLWGPIDGRTYGYGGEGALKYFDANFPKSEYKSLKALIMGTQKVEAGTAECGFTIKDEAKRATLPSTIVHSSFFHPGPCEVWCDNTKLAYALDCQTAYKTSKIPIDTSKCAGADRLTLYWLAVHGSPWQVYIDCVYLKGARSGGGAAAPTPAAGSPPTPAANNTAPAAPRTPKAPEVAPSSSTVGGEASIIPRASTAPATKNCKRSRQ